MKWAEGCMFCLCVTTSCRAARADNSSAHAINPLVFARFQLRNTTHASPATNTILCKATRGSCTTSAHRKVPRPMPTKLPLKPWLGTEVSSSNAWRVAKENLTGHERRSRRCAGLTRRWRATDTCSNCYSFALKEERGGAHNEKADEIAAPVTPEERLSRVM